MSENEIKKKLADNLRELKRAIDSLGWDECEECGKFMLNGLEEIHSYPTKDREVIVCYECLEKCERAMIEEG